ncbi:MAG: ECF transporter S component, partial [Firmicutes bacterium]|nr:ECF transporter S component [Bacillota bacterium]
MKTNTTDKTMALVLTGVLTALVTVCTMVLPIPIPMTTGYVNLGDGMIFLAVMLVGWKYGAFAGGVGAGLADILLGSAAWAPWTLVIKAGMAVIVGLGLQSAK